MKHIEKYLLSVLIFVSFSQGLLGPLYALFVTKIGGDIFDVSWAWSTYLIISGVLTFLLGRLSDKFGKLKFLIIGSLLLIIGTFAYLFVQEPWHLFIVQILLAIGSAFLWPVWDSLYSHYSQKGKEGREWGLAEGSDSVVLGISLIVGSYVVYYWGYTTLFIVMGIFQIFAFMCILAVMKLIKN